MAEVMKKATRDSYGEALVELGQENPNIVVFDADLAGGEYDGSGSGCFYLRIHSFCQHLCHVCGRPRL